MSQRRRGNGWGASSNARAGVDEIVSFEQGGATYYPLTDALGSVYA